MNDIKLCKDCKHFYAFPYVQWREPLCCRPVGAKSDVIWGHYKIRDTRSIIEIREDKSSCGPSAQFFEPKEGPKPHEVTITYERVPSGKWWQFWA